jgi:ribosomal protein S12 methylthiotransferase accessory factor
MYARHGLASLVQRRVGLISSVILPASELGAPSFEIAVTRLGALSTLLPYVTPPRPGQVDTRGGAGADPQIELAWVRAVAEGAERYANIVHAQEDFVVASAAELGDAAIDLDRLPRCSEAELANPRCPLRAPSKTEPMRWARGVSLISGRELHVPASFVHLFVPTTPSERITFPISTGVAAHPSLAAALLGALCEVVERDAIALTWLARLPLPRIDLSAGAPAELAPFLERLSASRVEQHFFDATTDVGLPTVFSVQVAHGHPSCAMFVSAATSFDASACIAKTIREAAPGRLAMAWDRTVPDRVEDFFELTHGADYYRTATTSRTSISCSGVSGASPSPRSGASVHRSARTRRRSSSAACSGASSLSGWTRSRSISPPRSSARRGSGPFAWWCRSSCPSASCTGRVSSAPRASTGTPRARGAR